MAFIRVQKLIYNPDYNTIMSGSASIMKSVYTKDSKFHSKQVIVEKLGKVIYLSEDKKSGIFLSPTRGLVEYNVESDVFTDIDINDERIKDSHIISKPKIHTIFGDAYFLLTFMNHSKILLILKNTFMARKDLERVLCHLMYGILRNGSRITCDNFISKSFLSNVFSNVPILSLKSDTHYFELLGNDNTRISFFKNFVKEMRKTNPKFGHGCYVDSTPLPNDISDNPFNALCCHGVSSSEIMMRLILVLDEETGLPVWYDIIPGNILDINTIMITVNDVASSINIEIESLVLDAGYVSKELLNIYYVGTEKKFIGRMPGRKGFPFKDLYWDVKNLIGKGKYEFVRNKCVYFGKKKEIEIFGHKEYAYVYIDHYVATSRYRDYLVEHKKEYDTLKDCEKDWITVKYGYFVLISNINTTPEDLLSQYFGRTNIETVFKTAKEYLDLLPLSKWSDATVRGKILSDIIETIILLQLRKEISQTSLSVNELISTFQSLMCFSENNTVHIETPNKKAKEYYKLFGYNIPSYLDISKYIRDFIE